jgi:hypothetical protein
MRGGLGQSARMTSDIFLVGHLNLVCIPNALRNWCLFVDALLWCFLFCRNKCRASLLTRLSFCCGHRIQRSLLFCVLRCALARRQRLCSKVTRLRVKLSRRTALDVQHLAERVFRSRVNFESVPLRPELRVRPWVAELRGLCVDSTRSVDLPKLALQCGKAETHLGCLTIGKNL